jgi:hypothetical protein
VNNVYWGNKIYNFNPLRNVNMSRFLIVLVIFLAGIIFINFDIIVEKLNDFQEPTFNITVEESPLGKGGALTLKVILKNVVDSPIFVGKLGISYIVFVDDDRYKFENRNIEVRKTIDRENPLDITVILPDYANPKFEQTASQWIRNKRKNFGIKISIKDNFGKTIQWKKIKLDTF